MQEKVSNFARNLGKMYLNAEIKKGIFSRYSPKNDPNDTGSPESQIALLTYRILALTRHLQEHKKDYKTQRALLKLVGRRKKLLAYLKRKDIERYRKLISVLNIREI